MEVEGPAQDFHASLFGGGPFVGRHAVDAITIGVPEQQAHPRYPARLFRVGGGTAAQQALFFALLIPAQAKTIDLPLHTFHVRMVLGFGKRRTGVDAVE
ncbi:hypothetical protein [uncultured Thiodictyon sp.]|uniref:hypothetical protein n=1 Tax=uncultured Thiodictyon sp. TaxID=1846217 RepID=UPI0025D95A4D|nr:hypothetical protein [uncultured Thiodictyon sp.]